MPDVTQPAATYHVGQPPKPRRTGPKPGTLIAIAAVSIVGIGAIVLAFALGWARAGTPAATASSPAASFTPAAFDEKATCVLLIPTLKLGQQQVQAILDKPDGTGSNLTTVEQVTKDLATIGRVAPASMRADIAAQAKPLDDILTAARSGGKHSIELTEWRASGIRLLQTCLPYAN